MLGKRRSSLAKRKDQARLTSVKVKLPFELGSAEWTPDNAEREAAWSLYVELVTRIAVQPLAPSEGLVREALSSLYSLFGTTRQILREGGPDVGGPMPSMGAIAVAVLNRGLRPFLAKWHPALLDWEATMPPLSPPESHEKSWPRSSEIRVELEKVRTQLEDYAKVLAEIAGVPH
jgi:hypothetical protein